MTSLYLPETRTAFMHIPKCAGTWISQNIQNCNIPNRRLTWLGFRFPHDYPPFARRVRNTVAFIRHPLTWYPSVWNYLRTSRKGSIQYFRRSFKSYNPFHIPSVCWSNDFDVWMESMLSENPCYFGDLMGKYLADHRPYQVGHVEHLGEGFLRIFESLGYVINPGLLDNSPINSNPANIRWRDDLRCRVLEAESAFLDRWYPDF